MRKHIADTYEMNQNRYDFYTDELEAAYRELDARFEAGEIDPLLSWELTDDLIHILDGIDLDAPARWTIGRLWFWKR